MTALRPPGTVMRLARMGAFHQTRLSFMRALMRRMKRENWRLERPVWRIDDNGEGVAVYAATGPARTYSLVAFGHILPPELRTDRVIAEAWDATFALFDGVPAEADLERLARNVPKQEAGRCAASELVLARANRSVRLFEHVVARLAEGQQPDRDRVEAVGYLMRTTAVYGNGKFGLADRDRIIDRPEISGPFRAEMLSVWLIRAFTTDLAEHLARARSPETAVRLDPALRRRFGVGNATGLGMAPFLVNHPTLLNSWILARETALARVRALPRAAAETAAKFTGTLARARLLAERWDTADPRQTERTEGLGRDLAQLADHATDDLFAGPCPWDEIYRWAEDNLSLEGQEMTVTLLLEPHGELVDDLTPSMRAEENEAFRIDGGQTIAALSAAIEADYAWALGMDYDDPAANARFWYVSEEKLEPRLGERHDEPGAELEEPLDIGRDVARLYRALDTPDGDTRLAEFLLPRPEHRRAARRVQIRARHPYAEIRDNLIGAELLPIDLLRCKLSFFGATKFDPRSDRWTRITMYQDAPFPDEFAGSEADDWAYPPAEAAGQ